ncbi:MAG: hypothetical protein ACJ8FT_07835 [Sphingomonas sp.]
MKTICLALAAALLATSGTAVAQNATDARCILLSNAFAAQTKDATQQKLAEDTLYFYLGRISGQPTTAQMKAVMDEQGKTLNDTNAGTLMGDCVKAVQAKVQLLQDIAVASKPQAAPKGR